MSSSHTVAAAPAVWRKAAGVAGGGAGIALVSSFVALGALMSESGFALWQAMLFSVFGYALPGQMVAAELHSHGASLAAIVFTVLLVNMRLLPMTVALLPLLAEGETDDASPARRRWQNLATSHLVAATSWVCFLTTYQTIAIRQRRLYYWLLGGMLWGLAAAATTAGYFLGGLLPKAWLGALLFLNPAYFLFLMLSSLRQKSAIAAFAGGALLLPFVHHISAQWDIMICGLLAGAGGYFAFARREHNAD